MNYKFFQALFFLINLFAVAQSNQVVKFPFDTAVLERIAIYKSDTLPIFKNGKFYYINIKTKKNVFEKSFDIAYPFVGANAVIQIEGKFGVINKKGDFFIPPDYHFFHIPSYDDDVAIFRNIANSQDNETVVNLYHSNKKASYVFCGKPAFPQYYVFNEKQMKGIKNNQGEIVIESKYQDILLVNFTYFIAKQKNKIGVVNFKNEIIIPFEYHDVTFTTGKHSRFPTIIGLQKEGQWEYYNNLGVKSSFFLKSKYKCEIITDVLLPNAVGIFSLNNKKNVLFKDGSILLDNYDWISDRVTVGIQDHKVYIIFDNKNRHLYYERN